MLVLQLLDEKVLAQAKLFAESLPSEHILSLNTSLTTMGQSEFNPLLSIMLILFCGATVGAVSLSCVNMDLGTDKGPLSQSGFVTHAWMMVLSIGLSASSGNFRCICPRSKCNGDKSQKAFSK